MTEQIDNLMESEEFINDSCLNWTLAAFCLKIGMFQPGSSPMDLFHGDGQADLKLETVRKPVSIGILLNQYRAIGLFWSGTTDLADLADLAPSVCVSSMVQGLTRLSF
jgi:hypothetical protein